LRKARANLQETGLQQGRYYENKYTDCNV